MFLLNKRKQNDLPRQEVVFVVYRFAGTGEGQMLFTLR